MTAKYVRPGDSFDYTPNADVAAGAVVVVGDIVAVSVRPIPANTTGTLASEGAFRFPKEVGSSTAIAAGVKVYWDAGNQVVTTTAGSNKVAGYTLESAGDDDTSVVVKLSR